jgi:hypothetical protein
VFAEKNGTSHESGEELPAGQMADTGQSSGLAQADCEKKEIKLI